MEVEHKIAPSHLSSAPCYVGLMPRPTSLRLSDELKGRLERVSSRSRERQAALAVRLLDEGLRMSEHPGIVFHASPAHGRVAGLAGGPDVAEVIDVLTGLASTGAARLAEAGTWLGLHPSRVRVAMAYYADHSEEIDGQIARRHAEAEELRRRLEAERALLE